MTHSATNHDIYALSKNRMLNTAIDMIFIYSLRVGDLMKSISSISSSVLNKKPARAEMANSILCKRGIVAIHIKPRSGLSHGVGKSDISYAINKGTVARTTSNAYLSYLLYKKYIITNIRMDFI
jgi:hypothetical protein